MHMPRKLIIFGLIATAITSVALFSSVSAEDTPITDAQINRIKSSCISAKNTLNQLHATDALLRVNRGQIYLSLSTKLMTRFNTRVESNNLNAKDLVSVTNRYNSALKTFTADYKSYEEQLSVALRIDCTNEPVTFYDAVASARTKRTQVNSDVTILHQLIDEYASTFDVFSIDFSKQNGAKNS